MKHLAAAATVAALALAGTAGAASLNDARIETSKQSLNAQIRHSRQVIAFFEAGRGRWMIHPRHRSCSTVKGVGPGALCRRSRAILRAHRWLLATAERRLERLYPPLTVEQWVASRHPCLHRIIGGENRRYDPTLDYGGGHGNVEEAYGIPQANPGTKMSTAGADWRTNPWTQIRWMLGYVTGKYGGECQALAVKLATGIY